MTYDDIIGEIDNSQLDLDRIFKLNDVEKSIVCSLYKELLNEFKTSGRTLDINMLKVVSLFNTLRNNNYLITNREKNIDSILQTKQ